VAEQVGDAMFERCTYFGSFKVGKSKKGKFNAPDGYGYAWQDLEPRNVKGAYDHRQIIKDMITVIFYHGYFKNGQFCRGQKIYLMNRLLNIRVEDGIFSNVHGRTHLIAGTNSFYECKFIEGISSSAVLRLMAITDVGKESSHSASAYNPRLRRVVKHYD